MIEPGTHIDTKSKVTLDIVFDVLTAGDAASLGRAFANMSPWSDYEIGAETLTEYLSNDQPGAPRLGLFIPSAKNQLVGAVGLRENWLRGPYIQFLGLLSPYQRSGIGAATVRLIEEIARNAQNRNLWVAVSAFNQQAIAFYEHFGFERAAVFDDLIADSTAEVLMRKRLYR